MSSPTPAALRFPRSVFSTADELAGAFSPRAAPSLRRGWELAQRLLSRDADEPTAAPADAPVPADARPNGEGRGEPVGAVVLSATLRSIVVRVGRIPAAAGGPVWDPPVPAPREPAAGVVDRVPAASAPGRGSVVLVHHRRRDGAVNSGGFGYLRALHGSRHLPRAPRPLAHDDAARVLVLPDLGRHPTVEQAAAATESARRAEVILDWLAQLPQLVAPGDSLPARRFTAGLRAADPRGTGGFPSVGLLRRAGLGAEDLAWAAGEHGAGRVFWNGDLHPGNTVLTEHGPVQLDAEGAQVSPAALIAVDAARAFPAADPGARWRESLSPARWWEQAELLAQRWGVSDGDWDRALRVQAAVLEQLTRPAQGSSGDSPRPVSPCSAMTERTISKATPGA